MWIASRAQEDADAEDMEIARLLEQLEGLDEEQVANSFSALCHIVSAPLTIDLVVCSLNRKKLK